MLCKSFILCTILALPLALFGEPAPGSQPGSGQSAESQPANGQSGKAQSPQGDQGKQQLSNSDKLFLKALIQEDISEINLAKLALQKSSNTKVKQYAQSKILGADPEMRDGAERIARDHGMTPPGHANARQKQMYDKLSKKSGKVFDDAYMNYEASQQSADVKLANTELKTTKSSAIKSYLKQQKAPIVEAASAAKTISTGISSAMTNYRQQAVSQGDQPKP